jgi:hypothetical protein
MSWFYRLFFLTLFVLVDGRLNVASARPPEKEAERSLLYWRYLCDGEEQEETIQNGEREFKCIARGWKVRTKVGIGIVREIIDESP